VVTDVLKEHSAFSFTGPMFPQNVKNWSPNNMATPLNPLTYNLLPMMLHTNCTFNS